MRLVHLRNFRPLSESRIVTEVTNESFVKDMWGAQRRSFPLPKGNSEAFSAEVRVEHGRWLVHCVFCQGAELADPEDRQFYCLSCHNKGAGNMWIPVTWPENADEIEEILLLRPEINRNWSSVETAGELRTENILHGIGV